MGEMVALIQSAAEANPRAGCLNYLCFDFAGSFIPLSLRAAVQGCADELRCQHVPDDNNVPGGDTVVAVELYPFRVNSDKGEDRPYTSYTYSGLGRFTTCPVCDLARRCARARDWRLDCKCPSPQDCDRVLREHTIHQLWHGGEGRAASHLITTGYLFLFLAAEHNLSRLLPPLEGGQVPADIYCDARSRLSQWLRGRLSADLSPVESLILDCLAGVEAELFALREDGIGTTASSREFGLKIAAHVFAPVPVVPTWRDGARVWEIEMKSQPVWACWVGPRSLLVPSG